MINEKFFHVQPETQILIGIFCTMYYSCVEVNNQVCAAGNYINDRPFLVHHSVLLWLSSSTHIHCVDCRPLGQGLCRCKINGSSSFSKQSRESCSSIHSSQSISSFNPERKYISNSIQYKDTHYSKYQKKIPLILLYS